jgi:selenocysteine-specific elongation factor
VRRFVLGTAGHVDHGKTTLVRALTGVDTDRLPEEKRRGITIELGFAPFHVAEGLEVSLIDVPGHRRFVHTMIAGAAGMELVLLVVAADEGVMPQTREHVAACELLGIKRCVVAVTKVDRVGREVAELAGEEAMELVAPRFEAEVAYCSARTGEGLEDVRAALIRALRALPPPRASGTARLSVDRVFTVRGAGTVVTGTLVEGRIAVGAPLAIVGASGALSTTARGLHVHDRAVEVAEAPTRLAVNLGGVDLESVHRGDVVTDDKAVLATRVLDVRLRALRPVRRGSFAQLSVGTAQTSARIDVIVSSAIEPLEEGVFLARLRLREPVVAVGGDRFVLRGSDVDGPAGAVLGGGEVLDARPNPRRVRERRVRVLDAIARGDAADALKRLVEEASPRPLPLTALAARFPIAASELARAADRLVQKGELARLKAAGLILPSDRKKLANAARALVTEHHRTAPLDRGMPLATLRARLAERAGEAAADEAMRAASEETQDLAGHPIVIEGDIARASAFGAARASEDAGGIVGLAARALRDAALKGVTENQMKEATGASPKEVKALLSKLVRDKLAFHAGELWFSRAAFDELVARVRAHLAASGKLTIAEFKEMTGMGRKQSIVLLEQLEREGVTRRVGDDRFPV